MLSSRGLRCLRSLTRCRGQLQELVIASPRGLSRCHGLGELVGFLLASERRILGFPLGILDCTGQGLGLLARRIDAHRGFAHAGLGLLRCLER